MTLIELGPTDLDRRSASMDEEEMLDTVMHQSLALKPDENVLVVTDSPMQFLGELFAFGACRVTNQMRLIVMPVAENHGSEPPYPVAKAMCETDVGLLLTSKSLSHTEARETASASGARIASMPTITYEMALRTLCIDYCKMSRECEALASLLTTASALHISSAAGTDLHLNIRDRRGHPSTGLFTSPGAFGNLPDGEAFIAPNEGEASGTLVIDGTSMDPSIESATSIRPTVIEIQDGLANSVAGMGKAALEAVFDHIGDGARNIAELGIGTNPATQLTGNVLESEKVAGTAHVALGNNFHIGGTVNVPFHLDGVITRPTVLADGTPLVENGRLAV